MENYEQKFKIGDSVKGVRTFNGEIIEGKFNGFYLYNKLNPNSVVGVIMTNEGCYDVSVDSIELTESDDERIREEIIEYLKLKYEDPNAIKHDYDKWIAWLEKQGKQKPIEQDTEIKDLWVYIIEWKDKFGRLPKDEDELAACIDYVMKRQRPIEWSKEDELMIQDAIHWIQEFQKSDRCNDENDMQNSVTCENWLKSFKPQTDWWKPTEEQLKALRNLLSGSFSMDNSKTYQSIESLYNDLKNL